MKINLVVDNLQSWFWPKAVILRNKLTSLGHNCALYSDAKKIKAKSDISFFLSCEKYISQQVRNKSKFNIVIHAAKLPYGKGMSPVTWQILGKKNIIPVTLFEVADKIDAGNVYFTDSFKLNGFELVDEWRDKLFITIEKMAIKFIKQAGRIKSKQQIGQSTYFRRRTPIDSRLDVNKSLAQQFNLLRVVDNNRYPAYFYFKKRKYILKIFKNLEK